MTTTTEHSVPGPDAPGLRDHPQRPALVLVGHGSRDPRSAATLARLADRVRRARPEVEVRLSFLEHSLPSLEQALALGGPAVVVPLLLGSAYHARTDLPTRLAAARAGEPGLVVRVAPGLGPDPVLEEVVRRRAAAVAADAYLLVAAGSSRAAANVEVQHTARRVAGQLGRPVAAAFATAAEPTVGAAVRDLYEAGAASVGVLPWFLAPGVLLDRALTQAVAHGARLAAAPLGDHRLLAELALSRYDQACAAAPLPVLRRG